MQISAASIMSSFPQVRFSFNAVSMNERVRAHAVSVGLAGRLTGYVARADDLFDLRSPPLPVALRQINTTGKFLLFRNPKSVANSGHPVPARGAVARRHERGMGCGGRGSVGMKADRRAGFP